METKITFEKLPDGTCVITVKGKNMHGDASNGLKVTTKKGTVKIYAGEIVERGNLNGCH